MPIPWQSSVNVFAQILRERGADPDAVHDVELAWDAFGEFLQTEVEGVAPPEQDGDGFIVQWGRWPWNDHQPSLTFGRQLAVTDPAGGSGSSPYPTYWHLQLQLIFNEDRAWADLDSLGRQHTGFEFDALGASRTAALESIRRDLEAYPQLTALWRTKPLRSDLSLGRVS